MKGRVELLAGTLMADADCVWEWRPPVDKVQLRFEAFQLDDALDEFQLCTRQANFEAGFFNCRSYSSKNPPPRVLDYWTPLRMRIVSRAIHANATVRAASLKIAAYKVVMHKCFPVVAFLECLSIHFTEASL